MIINLGVYKINHPSQLPTFSFKTNDKVYTFPDQAGNYLSIDHVLSITSTKETGVFEIKFFCSGILTFNKLNSAKNIDIFCSGGGGAGGGSSPRTDAYPGCGGGGGAGSGVTNTYNVLMRDKVAYEIHIGQGAEFNWAINPNKRQGESSYFKEQSKPIEENITLAQGGMGGRHGYADKNSAGEGGWGWKIDENHIYGAGGNGGYGEPEQEGYVPPTEENRLGQLPFGEGEQTYGDGGLGGYNSGDATNQGSGEEYYGNGGGGGNYGWNIDCEGAAGGSGIIIIRNHRKN